MLAVACDYAVRLGAKSDSVEVIKVKSENQTNSNVETSGSRRRLIRGGMVGVPVLLALKSAPVLACNCKLPSGFSTSGNLSRNGGAACSEPAQGPDFWKTNLDGNKFKFTRIRTNTPFNSIFGGYDTTTLLNVLNQAPSFASLVVAAHLDVTVNRYISGVSTTDILNMWNEHYVPPGATTAWSRAQSESYLKYTMGLQ